MRYLGIDYGQKRIGLAVGDSQSRIATPIGTIHETKADRQLAESINRIEEYAVNALVIGLPLNMDGSEGPQAKETRMFADQLAKASGKPVHFHDERLSSFSAQELVGKISRTRKKKRRPIDSIAAQVILQEFLDNLDQVESKG
ncbi:MAG: Holliday junction resolvase RuvX [Planctomycetes bacterium]|nr:Holliday junction resolvase RuvX [Planctomycetota bacterium]MBI3834897.1 Holliday junction resolvase RuvX [Planctomycetota bacterium]